MPEHHGFTAVRCTTVPPLSVAMLEDFAPSSPCFLPLRRRVLARYLAHGTPPTLALEQAGLLAALLCRQQPQPPAQIERLLHEACALFAADPGAVPVQLGGGGGQGADVLETWQQTLAGAGVLLADETVVEHFLATSPLEYPGLAFQQACQVTLAEHVIRWPALVEDDGEAPAEVDDESADTASTDRQPVERNGLYTSEQARVLRAIAANPDELIDLQGYAGTGKGHLVLALLDARPGRYTYVAPTRGQVEAFRPRLPADAATRLLTQIEFANLLARHATRNGRLGSFVPGYRQSTLRPREIASRIGLQRIGARSPEQVLLAVFEGINRWCASAAPQLQARHFQRVVPGAMVEAAPYLAAAEHVWRCMFDPVVQKGGCLSLGVAHIGKWLWLHGATPPLQLGMILVDEAHDLSPAWKQLLATHAPGVVSLADPHQRLQGHVPRWSSSKQLEMHQSVRQGSQVDSLVNRSLALDGLDDAPQPFHGASDRATAVRRFARWEEVPVTGMRLYGSVWRLLLETTRLLAQGARVHVHPASLRTLQRDVQVPIDAWRSRREGGSAARWEGFASGCEQRGQREVADLFASGFDAAALARLLAALVEEADATVVLCLAPHAKNMQYARVSMSACCFAASDDARLRYHPVRAAYLAMTRASGELWVPQNAADLLQASASA